MTRCHMPAVHLDQIESEVLDGDLSKALRLCVSFGSQVGSDDLRTWATKELLGYNNGDTLPEFRRVVAPVAIDGVRDGLPVWEQHIDLMALPKGLDRANFERAPVGQGVDELEETVRALTGGKFTKVLVPGGPKIAGWIMDGSQHLDQQITKVYWAVERTAFVGVLGGIRTVLIQLLAEVRARTSSDEPGAKSVDAAVQVAVTGNGNYVNVQTSGRDSSTSLNAPAPGGFWTRLRLWTVGAVGFVGSVITIWVFATH